MNDYIVLAIMGFIQNFTNGWNSRARNSADIAYHYRLAFLANFVWFISYAIILKNIWASVLNGNITSLLIVLIIYSISTSTGSACAMWWSLRTENGRRCVGARKKDR